MRCKGILLVCLVMFLAAPLAAQVTIPNPLPAFQFTYSPTNPTTADQVNLQISGLWPDNCPPDSGEATVDGNDIVIALLLPGATGGTEPNCTSVRSAYSVNVTVGPLAAGTYSVGVRVVSASETTASQGVGSFTVGIPAGGGGEPNVPVAIGPGTCVVILQDCASMSLKAGQAGVVVCCDTADCSGRFLISWFLNTAGVGTSADCNETNPRIIPPASATWVDPSRVGLGVCFDECGVLQQNEERCYTLTTDAGLTYVLVAGSWLPDFLGEGAQFQLGDRVRVQGLINIRRPEGAFFSCTAQSGDIYNPVITPCTPAGGGAGTGCCTVEYTPGDRVRLLVDNPMDMTGRTPTGLLAGTMGTVVCCNAGQETSSVFVSFDNFTDGNDMSFLCRTAPTITYPAGSGWWVSCDQIMFVSSAGGGGNPCPNDNMTIGFGTNGIEIFRDPNCTTETRTFSGCVNARVTSNFRARLSLRITPLATVGGTWTGTVTPDVIPAGESTVAVCVTAMDLDLTAIPAGQNMQVATVSIMAVPEPE
ncbi:MAG: hypothetical protein ACM3VT_06085 [Solirubrobacterales bacterium]